MDMPEIIESDMTPEQKILWSITSLWSNFSELKTRADKNYKVLFEGNGELPIVEQVRNLNTFVNGVRYWMKFLIGALLLQTMAFLGTAIVYFIKLSPFLDQLSKSSGG